jgi:hypothetical protein
MKEELKGAKWHIIFIKVFAVLGIVAGVGFLGVAAWAWGLLTAAEDVGGGLVWQGPAIPQILLAVGILFLIIFAGTLISILQVSKALSIKTDELDK